MATNARRVAPDRVWACMAGPMAGMFVSGGFAADWPEYVRADIAAAPDMLTALKEAQSVLATLIDPGSQHVSSSLVFFQVMAAEEKARAAIAKAEGREAEAADEAARQAKADLARAIAACRAALTPYLAAIDKAEGQS